MTSAQANDIEATALRLLRRLSTRTVLVRDGDDGYRLATNDRAGERVPEALVACLARLDLVAGVGGKLALSEAGAAYLRRSLAGGGDYRLQHGQIDVATVRTTDGVLSQAKIDRGESPLSALRHRRGRDGRPLVDAVEFEAGERLRSDFERGRLSPRVTSNWSAAVATSRRDGGAGGIAELTDAALGARQRVERAVTALGPELGGLVLDFCCFLKGLEQIERERRWPVRSAKLVLKLGLQALARHYGLAHKARGKPRSRAIVHWGAEDYRPLID